VTSVIPVTLSARVRALTIVMIQGGKRFVLRDVGPKRHDFTVTSTGPKINVTVENTPKDYLKLFLTENLVQGFVDETNACQQFHSQQTAEPALYLFNVGGRDSYRILVLFSYSYKYGHNWAPKYERLLEAGMVVSCSIFQLHIFKRQIYANILNASAFPHTINYRTTNKDKNNSLQTQGN
jgi:hypothetical protein